jgi:hypothetical protein
MATTMKDIKAKPARPPPATMGTLIVSWLLLSNLDIGWLLTASTGSGYSWTWGWRLLSSVRKPTRPKIKPAPTPTPPDTPARLGTR